MQRLQRASWLLLASLVVLALMAQARPVYAEESELFPFVINPWEVSPDNITNISGWLERPAGKDGFVRAQGGRFVTADGKPIRFFGVNLSYGANFPTKEEAERLADRLARFGINLVRFHHTERYDAPDGLFTPGVYPRQIDPEMIDRLDYFVAQLKERGIYSNFNLKTARQLQPEEGFPFLEGRATYDKGLDLFHPDMIAEHKRIYRELLTHVNPYTGNPYTDEPALVQIEITNENGIFYSWQRGELDSQPQYYLDVLDELWVQWLREKYETTEALREAWRSSSQTLVGLPEGESLETGVSRPTYAEMTRRSRYVQSDYVTFLYEIDLAYFEEMYRFLKEELGVKSLVAGTQVPLSAPQIQAQLDYVDTHLYFRHPQFPGTSWDGANWYIENNSLVNTDGGTIPTLAGLRVAGKPFTVSEYNHPAPNTYGSEAFLLIGAYGAFQDWSGIVIFDWSLNRDYDAVRLTNYFNTKAHSTKLVTLPAVHALFVRGDVEVGKELYQVPAPDPIALYWERSVTSNNPLAWLRSIRRHTALMRRIERLVPGIEPSEEGKPLAQLPSASVFTTDTGELTWDASVAQRGLVTVDTKLSKAAIGYGAGRTIKFRDGVTLEPGDTMQDGWSAITLTVIDGEGFDDTARILLTATGFIENSGMIWRELGGDRVTLDSWGSAPVMVEGIPARISFELPQERVRVYALDATGNRSEEVPVTVSNQSATFEIGPAYRTLWYEVVIE